MYRVIRWKGGGAVLNSLNSDLEPFESYDEAVKRCDELNEQNNKSSDEPAD